MNVITSPTSITSSGISQLSPQQAENTILDVDVATAFDLASRYYHGIDGVLAQNKERAFHWFLCCARKDHVMSQYRLGLMFLYEEEGIPKYDHKLSIDHAIEWFTKASNQGDEPAMKQLVNIYYNNGNHDETMKWFIKLAEKNNPTYQFLLAKQYLKLHNSNQFLYWIKESALLGYSDSQYTLGEHFFRGQLLTQDYDQSFYWYSLAAEQDHMLAIYALYKCLKHGYGTEVNAELAEAFRIRSHTLMQQVFPKCQRWLEHKEHQKAAYWLEQCARLGNQDAQFQLATLFEHELASTKLEEAILWYTKLAMGEPASEKYQEAAKLRLLFLTGY